MPSTSRAINKARLPNHSGFHTSDINDRINVAADANRLNQAKSGSDRAFVSYVGGGFAVVGDLTKMAQSENIPDFSNTELLEDNVYSESHKEGELRGERAGFAEGWCFGYGKSAELGREVGFYRGNARAWLSILEQKESNSESPAKLALILEEILTIADEFPLQDPSEQKMITLINKLRSKFRKAQTLLGVPQPNKTELSAKEAVSF